MFFIDCTGALKQLGAEFQPGDSEVLLRFLTENTSQPRAVRSSNDRLFDILKRNLATPKSRETWEPFTDNNRVVQVVVLREHVWTMSTTAVRLSDAMYKSWVTRAGELYEISRHPSLRVSTPFIIPDGLKTLRVDLNKRHHPHAEQNNHGFCTPGTLQRGRYSQGCFGS
jgi:hypothetical protein